MKDIRALVCCSERITFMDVNCNTNKFTHNMVAKTMKEALKKLNNNKKTN